MKYYMKVDIIIVRLYLKKTLYVFDIVILRPFIRLYPNIYGYILFVIYLQHSPAAQGTRCEYRYEQVLE